MNIAFSLRSLASILILALASASAAATTISGTFVRSSSNFFSGIATDTTTGKVYLKSGYEGSKNLSVYANQAAFEAGTVESTVTLASAIYGTYFAVEDGAVYARTSSSDNEVSVFNASSGAVITDNKKIGNISGANFDATFDWGGFSTLNALNDGDHLYLIGGSISGSDFRINTYDFALAQQSSYKLDIGTPGFAFSINGYIFFGDNYNSGAITRRVNAATGAIETVDFTLTNVSAYLNNVSYDAFDNTLYVHSANGIYRIANADEAFAVKRKEFIGAPRDVPEPESILLVGIALAGMGFARRATKRATIQA